jgi:tetratricopeptide (TPR) repeat protein
MAVGLATSLLAIALLAAGCDGDVDARIADAIELQETGQLEASIDLLREIVDEEPANADASFLLGSALVQTGRPWAAIDALRVAADSDAYAVPAGVLLAAAQFYRRAYDDALAAANRVLAIDPDSETALFTRARAQLARGRADEALSDAERILALREDSYNGLAVKASALVRLDRADEAEAIWLGLRERTAREGSPTQAARSCAQLAVFYRNADQNDRAESVYDECLDAYPTQVFLQTAASDFFVETGQPDRAIEVYRDAIEAAPSDLRGWNRLADLLYDLGRADEAGTALEEMVERFDSPAAWRLLAGFQRKMRHTEQAREAIEEAILRSERPSEAFRYALADLLVEEGKIERARAIGQNLVQPSYRHLLAGAILLRSDDPASALKRLDAGLTLWPDNAHAHYLAGEAALALRDRRRAVIEFREALRLGHQTTDAALRLAEIYFARGDYAVASRVAIHQIENRPYLDPTPYHIAVRSLLRQGRIDDAGKVVAELAKADPESPALVVETTAIRRAQGGPSAATKYILSTGRDLTDAENEPILRALANDLNALDRGEEALARIDRAVERDDESAPLHDLRARVLSHLGRNEAASAATERALEIDPSYAPALEMRAYFALERGEPERALEALDAATEAAPDDSNYPYGAASVARQMGDTEGAIDRLEEALARQPLFGPAANDLAWILATDRLDLERALRLAQLAARQERSTERLATLGWVQHQRGEYADAIRTYRTALASDPDLPSVRYHLGLSLSESGQKHEAEDLLDALVEGPDFPEIDAARKELARLKGS